jgi:PAS domain S-box-containing protein
VGTFAERAWLVELTKALTLPDAKAALARARAVLEAQGITPTSPPADDATAAIVSNVLASLTAREQAELEHRRTQERSEMLAAASFEGLFFHHGGVVIDANDRLSEMLGYSHDEIVGMDVPRVAVAPEDLPEVQRRLANGIEGEYVVTAIRKDGTRFRAAVLSQQGRLGERPVRVVATRDVTERERTTALLREGEARFRDLAEAAFDMTVFSRDGVVVEARGDVQRLVGISREELIGRSMFDFVAPSSQPTMREMVAQHRFGSYEATIMHPDGVLVPTHVVVVASTLNGEPVRAAGVRDLRAARHLEIERRALEQQVERAQRLDSLGVLAGGIAHDFNNLLAGVLGNAEILRDGAASEEDAATARSIVAAAQRAAGLTRQMLAYAGQRELGSHEPIELGALLGELGTLLDATLSKKAQVRFAIEPDSVVVGDRATIAQVFMNLLTNASDALGDGTGRIDVRARHVRQVDARWDAAQGKTVGPGRWILIEVADTGAGMDEATKGRVFEPFFTTKETGHGLGLAACLGIISAHGGAILVESEQGRGSCFSVLLPAGNRGDDAGRTVTTPTAGGSPCSVLVIDDEALVRTQLRRSLELRGYAVSEAADGRRALAMLADPARPRPDVIVLDMTMPEIDGAQVLRRLREMGLKTPVVVSSGFLDAAVERHLPRGEFQVFLAKPYGASDLVAAIERARATTG